MNTDQYQSIAPGSLQGFLEGYSRVPRQSSSRMLSESRRDHAQRHASRVASAAELFGDLLSGAAPAHYLREAISPSSPEMAQVIESNYPGLLRPAGEREIGWRGVGLQEAMSVSDFPLLMGDVMDRMLLARFAELPQVWRQYISVGAPLRDFRQVKMLETTGGNEAWDTISDLEGLTYTALSEGQHTLSPALYGKAMRLSWRLLMNDDLDAFSEIPAILARGGRRTLNTFATDLLFDANGPDAVIFTTGKGNRLSGNPVLNIANLALAVAALLKLRDSTGEPISIEGVRLVYGPALHVTVQNILNTLTVDTTTDGGAATGRALRVNNWVTTGITAVMDPYIPVVASSANGDTSWMVTAAPNSARPLARIRFLQGFENPVLYQKAPNTQRVGGGLDADVGDFQSMASEFKGLIAFGGTVIEEKAAIVSNGSGS